MAEVVCVHRWSEWYRVLPAEPDLGYEYRLCSRCDAYQRDRDEEPRVVIARVE